MDKFKQYLNQHQDELGDDEPGAKVCANLQKEFPEVRQIRPINQWYKYAAAACVLMLCAISLWYFLSHDKTNIAQSRITKIGAKPITRPVKTDSVTPTIVKAINPISDKEVGRRKSYRRTIEDDSSEPTELKHVEASFTSVINLERRKINRTPLLAEDRSYFGYFKARFHKIDEDEAGLKKEIHEQGFTNDMLLQLIDIYQQKLDILKDLQTEINKTNTRAGLGMPAKEEKHRSYINI
jgi:hypothetical protein